MKRIVNFAKRASAVFALLATTQIALSAQTFTTLHSFDGTDGANPYAGLVQATNGDLYGTTSSGGPSCAPDGCGTIFKITPRGALTTLYSFCANNVCTDGATPYAGLVQATDGDLYGTNIQLGGNFDGGTVFKINPSGTLTTLYSFCLQAGCADGDEPWAPLIQARNSDLYGTTVAGGANPGGTYGLRYGTVFKITPNGTLTTLYSFCSQSGCTDGYFPWGGLLQATNGDLYGTTYLGGSSPFCQGCGTLFRITPSGTLTTLYSFCTQSGCADGANPNAGLIEAINGDLYGTTSALGAYDGGTIFKITPSGTLTTLYSFCTQNGCADGANPSAAALVEATDGNFYGTTSAGGANGQGTVFKMTPSGALTTLYSFCSQSGCTDGATPYAGLVQDTNGTFYGTTYAGGANGVGTVFSLSVGLGPFVETRPTSGAVGAAVEILGSDLTGATGVSFNGTAAAFTVASRYLITTTVPAGATTGKVRVVIPSRTLSSNVSFRVQP